MARKVLRVDIQNNSIEYLSKALAHEKAILHRAFSVFVHVGKENILLQKRNILKYHSGGLWTNTCCSHPLSENIIEEAIERMKIEVGFSCKLEEVGEFIYFNKFEESLFEYEYDHVLIGCIEDRDEIDLEISNEEVSILQWIHKDELEEDMIKNPLDYTVWFFSAYKMVADYICKQ